MPFWLIALLFVGAGVAVAAVARRPVTERDVDQVVAHALIAESNTAVLRKLQVALSMAGRLPQADACMFRANAIDARNARELQAVRVASQTLAPIVVTTCEQRALEWSKMYGWTYEVALQKVREKVSSCR